MFRPSDESNSADADEGQAMTSRIKSHVAAFVVLVFLFRAAKIAADRSSFGFGGS